MAWIWIGFEIWDQYFQRFVKKVDIINKRNKNQSTSTSHYQEFRPNGLEIRVHSSARNHFFPMTAFRRFQDPTIPKRKGPKLRNHSTKWPMRREGWKQWKGTKLIHMQLRVTLMQNYCVVVNQTLSAEISFLSNFAVFQVQPASRPVVGQKVK